MAVSTDTLCKGFPAEFAMYLKYCRGLKFDESPDYMYLRQMFRFVESGSNFAHFLESYSEL